MGLGWVSEFPAPSFPALLTLALQACPCGQRMDGSGLAVSWDPGNSFLVEAVKHSAATTAFMSSSEALWPLG